MMPLPEDDGLIELGKIVAAFGIKGWVKIRPYSSGENLAKYNKLHVLVAQSYKIFLIKESLFRNGIWHVKFANIDTRDDALDIVGSFVALKRGDLPPTIEGEYYWVDLVGLAVINTKQQNFGIVDSLMDVGANSILVVKMDNKEWLVPFVATYVVEVDTLRKQIIIDWEYEY